MTNIGITGGGNDTHMVYVDGEKVIESKMKILLSILLKQSKIK